MAVVAAEAVVIGNLLAKVPMSFLRYTRRDALSTAAAVRWWGDDDGCSLQPELLIGDDAEEGSAMGMGDDAPVVDVDENPPPEHTPSTTDRRCLASC